MTSDRCSIRMLIFGASLRGGSLNDRLADLAAVVAAEKGAEVDRARMADFDCPSYDGDVKTAPAFPSPPAGSPSG